MLVPLIHPSWKKDHRLVIVRGTKALVSAGHTQGKTTDIASLADGEELWLYSHGSSTTFCGTSAKDLADWLRLVVKMPAGERRVVLKGCKTGEYATAVQEILNGKTGYEKVIVAGFEGEASQTSKDGTMTIRRGGASEVRKAKEKAALEDLVRRRKAAEDGRKKSDVDKESEVERPKAEKLARTYGTTYDESTSTFVGDDDRMRRRERRSQSIAATTTTTTKEKEEDGGSNDEMEVEYT
jgi:hypothetical protein